MNSATTFHAPHFVGFEILSLLTSDQFHIFIVSSGGWLKPTTPVQLDEGEGLDVTIGLAAAVTVMEESGSWLHDADNSRALCSTGSP